MGLGIIIRLRRTRAGDREARYTDFLVSVLSYASENKGYISIGNIGRMSYPAAVEDGGM